MVSEGHAKLVRLERQERKNNLPANLVNNTNPAFALEDHTTWVADINANLKANLGCSLEERQNTSNLERSKSSPKPRRSMRFDY